MYKYSIFIYILYIYRYIYIYFLYFIDNFFIFEYIKYIKVYVRNCPDRSGEAPEGQNRPLYTFLISIYIKI